MEKVKLIFCITCISISVILKGQSIDTLSSYRLNDVTVTAPRLPKAIYQVPFAITQLDSSIVDSERQNLSVKEHLLMIPGVYVQNAYNFAQDARISIRGFGATAAFGIRGIKLIVDGIPETTPDGTGQLDNLNLDIVEDIQVIRGSASSLYGNASGGAIIMKSKFDFDDFIESKSMIGSYGFYSQALSVGVKLNKTILSGHSRWFGSTGFRDHNEFRQANTRVAARHLFNDRLSATLLLEYVNSPEAQDAGGLTLEETETDFSMARDRNATFDAGEEITQWKAGASLEWKWTENKTLSSYAFFNQRTFDGRLPFENSGIIELERNYFGVGNSLELDIKQHSVKLGYDLLSQTDDRQRFDNLEGVQGNQRLNQVESFLNFGWYFLDYLDLGKYYFSAGIRQDFNWLEADDKFLSDGNDSGEINIINWSYHLGASRVLSPSIQLFINHSTNFETPTLNQLSNRPDNTGGFENLDAATASSFELGMKWIKNSFSAEITGFNIQTENELVPYELAAFPERTFFRNAGSTNRKGLEFSANYSSQKLKVFSSYTFFNFEYDEYVANDENLAGFNLPGIPKHHAVLTLLTSPIESLELSVPIDYVGSLWVDDQNETEIDRYLEVSFSVRYSVSFTKISFTPSFGVRNLLDQQYFDNVRINAFGGRYYEPAPGRNYYIALGLRF